MVVMVFGIVRLIIRDFLNNDEIYDVNVCRNYECVKRVKLNISLHLYRVRPST